MKQAGRKTGSLAHMRTAPPRQGGLNWAAIEEARAKRLEEEYERGIRNPEVLEHMRLKDLSEDERRKELIRKQNAVTPKAPTPRSAQRPSRSGPRVDVDRIVDLYEAGVPPLEIVEQMAVGYGTVIKYLKKAKVFDPNRHRKGKRAGQTGE